MAKKTFGASKVFAIVILFSIAMYFALPDTLLPLDITRDNKIDLENQDYECISRTKTSQDQNGITVTPELYCVVEKDNPTQYYVDKWTSTQTFIAIVVSASAIGIVVVVILFKLNILGIAINDCKLCGKKIDKTVENCNDYYGYCSNECKRKDNQDPATEFFR